MARQRLGIQQPGKIYRKIIAIDFDGTLSYGKYPQCGPANERLLDLVKRLLSRPITRRSWYVLWTSRTGEALNNAVSWLADKGVVFDAVNEAPPGASSGFRTDSRKIPAFLFVDDRAISPGDFINSRSLRMNLSGQKAVKTG